MGRTVGLGRAVGLGKAIGVGKAIDAGRAVAAGKSVAKLKAFAKQSQGAIGRSVGPGQLCWQGCHRSGIGTGQEQRLGLELICLIWFQRGRALIMATRVRWASSLSLRV